MLSNVITPALKLTKAKEVTLSPLSAKFVIGVLSWSIVDDCEGEDDLVGDQVVIVGDMVGWELGHEVEGVKGMTWFSKSK